MTDWQPWPPPPDGELIEVEVPGRTGVRCFGCLIEDQPNEPHLQLMGYSPAYPDKSMPACIYRSKLQFRHIPPTARWRRV